MPDCARRSFASRSRAAVLLCAGLVLLQMPSVLGQVKTPPVYTSGVQLVAVDVRVTDRDGRPIGDLTARDFDVTIDGKPRKVEAASFVTAARNLSPSTSAGGPSQAHVMRSPVPLWTDPGNTVCAPSARYSTIIERSRNLKGCVD